MHSDEMDKISTRMDDSLDDDGVILDFIKDQIPFKNQYANFPAP